MSGRFVTGESLRDEKPPFSQNTSMTLKASAMTIHPIINGRDQSTSDALLAKRLNIIVMFNIHPPISSLICSITYNLDRAMCFRDKRSRNTAELKSFKSAAEPASSDED
jgi:hypothetical protein